MALEPAAAQDANAVVVTRTLADRYALDEIGDLRPVVAPTSRSGARPGAPTARSASRASSAMYGLDFARFLPLDVGGPLTHQALERGHVDVALLFTTDPGIAADDLVVLADDLALQPAENVTPVVHREVVDRWGPAAGRRRGRRVGPPDHGRPPRVERRVAAGDAASRRWRPTGCRTEGLA